MANQVSTRAGSARNGMGLLLSAVCRAHRNQVASALDVIRVHVGQDHMVYRLAIEDGITQTRLAEAVGVDASTVTKTLVRLERDGVVRRSDDTDDARVSRVYLTERGRALVNPVVETWNRADERLQKGLTRAERQLLHRLLQRVLGNLS